MTVTLSCPSKPHSSKQLKAVSAALIRSKKIVLVTGAGISVSCGIPDFRSEDGLYKLLETREGSDSFSIRGRDLFDSSLFRNSDSTDMFYRFISSLKRKVDQARPSGTHRFLKTLDGRGKLLRCYTQNIDGFESAVGLSFVSHLPDLTLLPPAPAPSGSSSPASDETPTVAPIISRKEMQKLSNLSVKEKLKNKVVQLHGDLHSVRCSICEEQAAMSSEHLQMFSTGEAPDCGLCFQRSDERIQRGRRKVAVGKLRPAIVLYGENHPSGDAIADVQKSDMMKRPDMLIIMGTSLKVHGLKQLVKSFASAVHDCRPPLACDPGADGDVPSRGIVVFVNATPPNAEWSKIIDYHVQGTTDKWCDQVVDHWKSSRPSDWSTQSKLSFALAPKVVSEVLKATKPAAPASRPKSEAENLRKQHAVAKSSPDRSPSRPRVPLSPTKGMAKLPDNSAVFSAKAELDSTLDISFEAVRVASPIKI